MTNQEKLIAAAGGAKKFAYAPYSGYRVGAALLGAGGEIFAGCNVENAALTNTVHAEGCALTSAIAAGVRKFTALAVVTDASPPAFPCALCRQTLAEFCAGDLAVYAANPSGEVRVSTLGELYPEMFSARSLGIDPETA